MKQFIKLLILTVLLMICTGCGVFDTTTTIEPLASGGWKITGSSDGIVEFDDGKHKFKADNRGRPSFIETVIGGLVLNPRAITDTDGVL